MKKFLIIPVLLFVAYFAWPAAAAWQLRVAVKARDMPAIESKVDWVTLRANLKQTIGGNLKEESDKEQHGVFKRALLRGLAPYAADKVIDLAVTPATLSKLLAGRSMLEGLGIGRPPEMKPAGEAAGQDADADPAADPLAPRRLRWMFFESPTRFRIEVIDLKMPGKRVVSILALQGASWKLVDVYYVTA
jgi:hypothetical protein